MGDCFSRTHSLLLHIKHTKNLEQIKRLLTEYPQYKNRIYEGKTLYDFAIERNSIDMVKLLIELDVKAYNFNEKGLLPIVQAVRSCRSLDSFKIFETVWNATISQMKSPKDLLEIVFLKHDFTLFDIAVLQGNLKIACFLYKQKEKYQPQDNKDSHFKEVSKYQQLVKTQVKCRIYTTNYSQFIRLVQNDKNDANAPNNSYRQLRMKADTRDFQESCCYWFCFQNICCQEPKQKPEKVAETERNGQLNVANAAT